MPSPTGSSPAYLSEFTGDNFIDSLLVGTDWSPITGRGITLTYSFGHASSVWSTSSLDYGLPGQALNGEPWRSGYASFTPAQANAARAVLETWSRYANITFTEVADTAANVGDIRFAQTPDSLENAYAWAYAPTSSAYGADIWVDVDDLSMRAVNPGQFGYFALLHEAGHALGLKHPVESSPYSSAILPAPYDIYDFTIMSYNVGPSMSSVDWDVSFYPTTPSALDIGAIQYLYGPNLSYHAGNDFYTYHQGQNYFETLWDAGGFDTIAWNATTQGTEIDLNPGQWSELGNALIYTASWGEQRFSFDTVHIYHSVVIENAIGGGAADALFGNAVANVLTGAGGNDTILGGAGDDWIEGDASQFPNPTLGVAGNDYLQGDGGNDTFLAGAGDDTVHGNEGHDTIVGEAGNDVLYGDEGNDAMDGRAGSDTLYGGLGVDILFGDADGDTLHGEDGNDVMMGERGTDSVLGMLDVLYGETGNDQLDGGAGDDWIYGGDGGDVIDGDYGSDFIFGGLGADIMLGSGASVYSLPEIGNDLFVYTSLADRGDQIWSFDMRPGEGDGIDLRSLFDGFGYTGSTPRADGQLYVFQNSAHTDIYVDANGLAGGINLTHLLTLADFTATNLTDSYFLFQ